MVNNVCGIYYAKMRRNVYVTPKSFLSFLSSYKDVYIEKVENIEVLEKRVSLGLSKLKSAEDDVKVNQRILEQEKVKIQEAERKTEVLLKNLQVEEAKAQAQTESVLKKKEECEAKATEIGEQKEEANKEL